jgi:hypothetical protein
LTLERIVEYDLRSRREGAAGDARLAFVLNMFGGMGIGRLSGAAALVALAACANVGAGPEVTGSLEVQVTVDGAEDPSGVSVTADGQSVTTGADGLAYFDAVPAGPPITVRATLGASSVDDIVTVEPDQLTSISLTLTISDGGGDGVSISALQLSPAGAVPAGGSATATVTADDSAGGTLSYEWDITDGWTIDGQGATAAIGAPDEAGVEGTVTVTVSSDAGGRATESAELVTVQCDDSPIACELEAFAVRNPIAIDTSQVSEPLTDVPILLVLPADRIDYDATAPDGGDLRVVSAELDEFLDFEIDTWDPGGTSHLWVRVPELPANTGDLNLWLYYGSELTGGPNPSGVWDADFRAVWHGEPDADILPDSSENANDATSPLADWSQRIVSSSLGRAVQMDGRDGTEGTTTDTYFEQVPASASLDLTESFTIEAFVEIDEAWPDLAGGESVDWAIVLKGPAGGEEAYFLGLSRRGGILNCRVFPAAADAQLRNDQPEGRAPGAVVPVGVPTYLACAYDGQELAGYVDGARVDTLPVSPGGSLRSTDADLVYIGRRFGDRRFGGLVDDVRISATARSDAWIQVQQLSIADQLVTLGEFEGLR